MGQYRPSGLIPSTLTSNYTIDATVANDFRCRINGTSPTTKYQLKIVKNDAASTAVYDSGVVTLEKPLYPVNYDGSQNELVVKVPADSKMENGNEYKWSITSYWSDTDKYESYENVFKAYATATLTITNMPTVLEERSYTFIAQCSQEQGVGVERFGWIIRDRDTLEESVNTIDDNNIYSSDVRVSYDGFLSGTTEEVKVKCWLNNGTSVETPFQAFAVKYQLIAFENIVSTKPQDDAGVLVRWNKLVYVDGKSENKDYQYVQDGYGGYNNKYIHIDSGNSISFDTVNTAQMNIPSYSSHVVSFRLDGNNDNIYKATGKNSAGEPYYIQLKVNNENFILDVNGKETVLFPKTVIQRWFTVVIEPKRVYGIEWSEDAPIYPAEDLFPYETLYPRYVISPFSIESTSIDIDDGGYWNSISVSGAIYARYIWIKEVAITEQEIDRLKDINNVPIWDNDTLMLALFNDNLLAGNIKSDTPVTNWIVYSNEVGSSFLKPIITVEAPVNSFIDYSVRNMTGVIYYISPVFGDKIGASASSNVAIPNWWDWFLVVCDEVEENVYRQIKTYRFDLDVSTGSMNNNTSFNELQNFTKYAKIQNSTSNYWSGTLSAFVGNCAVTYKDTVEQMEELKSLSTDGKDKFLKDRKGNLWKVRLNSAVSQNITDEYVEQAVVVTLGWAEIGDATHSVIINKM